MDIEKQENKENPDNEFLPLPYFPWDRRPSHIPIEQEEAATALFLADGSIDEAADRLKVHPLRLVRAINRSPRLTRLRAELVTLLNDRVLQEYRRAFDSEDDRRREWAAAKLANTKQFQGDPLAPNSNQAASLTINQDNREIIFHWRSGPPEPKEIDGSADIEHE